MGGVSSRLDPVQLYIPRSFIGGWKGGVVQLVAKQEQFAKLKIAKYECLIKYALNFIIAYTYINYVIINA